jgi:hypothetical protein
LPDSFRDGAAIFQRKGEMGMNIRGTLAACGLMAAVAALAAGESYAAPTTLLGVYEETANVACSNVSTCRVDFSTLVSPLRVTKVSCNFFFASASYNDVFATGIDLGQSSQNKNVHKALQYLAPVSPMIITATNNQYQVLADTLHVVPANWRPSVEVALNKPTTINMYCSISGSTS